MPFNLLGTALAVNCGVSVSRAGSQRRANSSMKPQPSSASRRAHGQRVGGFGNYIGADHGPRGGGDQQFLGDLLMRGDGMEGLVGDPLRGSVPIRPRAAEQQ
ncbi:MAG: hypothetical protein U1A81_01535, partial [Hydrogenophaga sp.]|nr:hypothetical protein [Hydrogenophaga sp.]